MGFRRRCCVGCLYGTFNVDTGFKADYLIELEKMLEKVLPYGMLKAKPNLESRIRTLKRDWEIVYDMDRAIRKDAQTAADIVEEIDVEDVDTTNTHGERNDFHGCEVDISLDDMDLSATQLQPPRNQGDSTFSKKKKKDF
ncbi:hypothetical protein Goklo_020953 [Gossypium klotzschianum]|uniref:Uncharacterized protein n=1 Tax=Gossypium klotzschianum TaxID=34286 RepID=A0A7J8UTV8_9ROSI|nr:hypothetical protein [Gossypium klotzschianum]